MKYQLRPRIMHPPHRTQLQFMVDGITGMAMGKKANTHVMISQHTETILIARPYLPQFHGPNFKGRFVARLHARRAIGIP